MVDSAMDFTKESIRVDDEVYIDVEYCWVVEGDKVDIYLRYEDGRMDTISFWPSNLPIDSSRALDLVRMCAALDYSNRESTADWRDHLHF